MEGTKKNKSSVFYNVTVIKNVQNGFLPSGSYQGEGKI